MVSFVKNTCMWNLTTQYKSTIFNLRFPMGIKCMLRVPFMHDPKQDRLMVWNLICSLENVLVVQLHARVWREWPYQQWVNYRWVLHAFAILQEIAWSSRVGAVLLIPLTLQLYSQSYSPFFSPFIYRLNTIKDRRPHLGKWTSTSPSMHHPTIRLNNIRWSPHRVTFVPTPFLN